MAIEKYVGQYVTAEDANEYIDGNTILNSCNLLQDAARKLSDIATACQELKEYLSSANLCIQGTSMEPMIEAYEKASNKKIDYVIEGRRAGDIDSLYCDPKKARDELGFVAKRDLYNMCLTSFNFQNKNRNGYE